MADQTTLEKEQIQQDLGIIGTSIAMREIVDVIRQVAPTDLTVLITGESGTGKEVIAKAIHRASKRANKPIISVNAGAIPEGIIESELFGHEKGSFTGASDTRKGYFELADNGTLFLDEIGDLPAATQVKFLRVLENGEYMRVGSANPRRVDVRVIAATNKDLETAMRQGTFREDLFFRLRSINIRIPALRERREDIPLLASVFAKQITEKNGIPFGGITDEAMDIMKSYHWPGNVRELRNTIESMLVIEGGKKIDGVTLRKYLREFHAEADFNPFLPVPTRKTPEQVERELIYRALLEVKSDILDIKRMMIEGAMDDSMDRPMDNREGRPGQGRLVEARVSEAPHGDAVAQVDADDSPKLSLEEMERKLITEALQTFQGNRRLAARQLNISERTLYRKIKEYGLL